MIYQVILTKKIEKELVKIHKKYQTKAFEALLILKRDPFIGKKLKGDLKGSYSLKIWPFRIIYQIYKRELIILVIRIGYRQGIYK